MWTSHPIRRKKKKNKKIMPKQLTKASQFLADNAEDYGKSSSSKPEHKLLRNRYQSPTLGDGGEGESNTVQGEAMRRKRRQQHFVMLSSPFFTLLLIFGVLIFLRNTSAVYASDAFPSLIKLNQESEHELFVPPHLRKIGIRSNNEDDSKVGPVVVVRGVDQGEVEDETAEDQPRHGSSSIGFGGGVNVASGSRNSNKNEQVPDDQDYSSLTEKEVRSKNAHPSAPAPSSSENNPLSAATRSNYGPAIFVPDGNAGLSLVRSNNQEENISGDMDTANRSISSSANSSTASRNGNVLGGAYGQQENGHSQDGRVNNASGVALNGSVNFERTDPDEDTIVGRRINDESEREMNDRRAIPPDLGEDGSNKLRPRQLLSNGGLCANWCHKNEHPDKCNWKKCKECDFCAPQLPCLSWCSNSAKPWVKKCKWQKSCAGCDACESSSSNPTRAPTSAPTTRAPSPAPTTKAPTSMPCKSWCFKKPDPWVSKCTWRNCEGCDSCEVLPPPPQTTSRPSSTPSSSSTSETQIFIDVTEDLKNGDNMADTFDIGSNHFPPSFIDVNGDDFLDMFYNNHWIFDYAADFDLGVSRLINSTSSALGIEFLPVNENTFVSGDSSHTHGRDVHGSTFADLDGDGHLDLLISVGGGRGRSKIGNKKDNVLFWGEETSEGNIRLVGGQEAAAAAGVGCSSCRGRFILITDYNGDGKIDVFPISDKRTDDLQTPTPLLRNNGDRTFTEDPLFYEFTRTILLTDADLDGFAQEYMVFRTTCFRDPAEFDHSTWDHNEFCEVRPEKTTAIYKYDDVLGEMSLISPVYRRSLEDQHYIPWNHHSAKDAVSGDFDDDQKADQIVLFADKMVFYYSSDRSYGELPLYNEEINQAGSFEMDLPCTGIGVALRFVDIDLNGINELLLLCTELGEFYLYSQTGVKQWDLNTSWNSGDLTQTTGWGPTSAEVEEACDGKSVREGFSDQFQKYCKNRNLRPKFHGLQLVDLNNDGFLDFVLSSSVGNIRFFANNPRTVRQNRFLVFKIQSTVSNTYAIGATLIFNASGLNPQFREISSYGGYGNAMSGGRDDRLVFGLGSNAMPESITVRWPSKVETVYDLTNLDASHLSNYSNPVILTEPAESQ